MWSEGTVYRLTINTMTRLKGTIEAAQDSCDWQNWGRPNWAGVRPRGVEGVGSRNDNVKPLLLLRDCASLLYAELRAFTLYYIKWNVNMYASARTAAGPWYLATYQVFTSTTLFNAKFYSNIFVWLLFVWAVGLSHLIYVYVVYC